MRDLERLMQEGVANLVWDIFTKKEKRLKDNQSSKTVLKIEYVQELPNRCA